MKCEKWLRKADQWRRNHNALMFIIALLLANAVWKWAIREGANGEPTLLGTWELSWAFDWAVRWTTTLSGKALGMMLDGTRTIGENGIGFANGLGIEVVWGCTAVKQSVLFGAVMAVSAGGWRRWGYMVVCWFVIFLLNVGRIVLIGLVVGTSPSWEPTVHDWVMKYGFYACLFALWLVWQERERRSMKNEQ